MRLFKSLKDTAQNFLSEYKQKEPATYAAAQQAVGGLLILDGFIGIDNPFGGKRRSGIFGAVTGVVVGIVMLFAPSIINGISGVNKMTATTTATIVSVGAPKSTGVTNSTDTNTAQTCTLTATYTVDGKEYTAQESGSSSANCGKAVGEVMSINYNPANPNNWSHDVKTIKAVGKIFFWFGILAIITGSITFVIRLFSIIFGYKILRSGRALAATLPPGTNLSTMIAEIKKNFTGSIFGFGKNAQAVPVPQAPVTPQPQSPQAPPPQNPETPPSQGPEAPNQL